MDHMKRQAGFTVIEVLVAIIFLGVATAVAFTQLVTIQREHQNDRKKTAINAMHYSLEEAYYKQHGFYPEKITDETLPTMDKELLKDPNGKKLGDNGSAYRYEPTNCTGGKCKSYSLRATLDGEADFIKDSRHK